MFIESLLASAESLHALDRFNQHREEPLSSLYIKIYLSHLPSDYKYISAYLFFVPLLKFKYVVVVIDKTQTLSLLDSPWAAVW